VWFTLKPVLSLSLSLSSWEKNPADFEPYHLKLEECMSADQIPTTEHIQGYVKKVRSSCLVETHNWVMNIQICSCILKH